MIMPLSGSRMLIKLKFSPWPTVHPSLELSLGVRTECLLTRCISEESSYPWIMCCVTLSALNLLNRHNCDLVCSAGVQNNQAREIKSVRPDVLCVKMFQKH